MNGSLGRPAAQQSRRRGDKESLGWFVGKSILYYNSFYYPPSFLLSLPCVLLLIPLLSLSLFGSVYSPSGISTVWWLNSFYPGGIYGIFLEKERSLKNSFTPFLGSFPWKMYRQKGSFPERQEGGIWSEPLSKSTGWSFVEKIHPIVPGIRRTETTTNIPVVKKKSGRLGNLSWPLIKSTILFLLLHLLII